MKLRLALLFIAIAIGSHLYLTDHFYQLALGLSQDGSACNIDRKFNCDTVSASRYSSFLTIPMAAWGVGANAILLILTFAWLVRWTDDEDALGFFTTGLGGFIFATSIVMSSISAFILKTYCIFCMVTYACSVVVFLLLLASYKSGRNSAAPLPFEFSRLKPYLWTFLGIPGAAYLMNVGILSNYGAKNLSELVSSSLADWTTAPAVTIATPAALVKGAAVADTDFLIQEFADFRCGHCKAASAPLEAFVSSRERVRLEFFNFPLDSTCNKAIDFGDGGSCALAQGVQCAESKAQKGWDMHYTAFKNQEEVNRSPAPEIRKLVLKWAKEMGFDEASFEACMASPETQKALIAQAEAGKAAGVKGTPTILVNGKKLPRGQALPVLNKALESVRDSASSTTP
jgi:protein-disulfide isomerase/uncharacterized membrane protein